MDVAEHIPVLIEETMQWLEVKEGGRYVDGTLGRAGHAMEIVRRGGEVLGIDRDDDAIAAVEAMGVAKIHAVKGRHGAMAEIARRHGWDNVDGVLLDLGVSSPQLDVPERGFSFREDGPLDMRMDRSDAQTAADIVNEWSLEELRGLFRKYGEEPRAGRIAAAIVKARETKKFETTLQLAKCIENATGRTGPRHPATRVFQALRMEVNREPAELESALNAALNLLKNGGRLAVVTFESITDRMVKEFVARHAGKMVSLQQGGETWEGEEPRCRNLTKKSITARDGEIAANPRSRSARLRAAERI